MTHRVKSKYPKTLSSEKAFKSNQVVTIFHCNPAKICFALKIYVGPKFNYFYLL